MPDLSSNATTLRSSGYRLNLYAAFFVGAEVYSATISAVDDTYTISELSITSGSGTIGDVERGMEVLVYNSSGNYKGSARVRRAGTISASNIPINETARGVLEIEAGDTISIITDHRLRPVFPEASATFDPDKEVYASQTEALPPIACSGGHFATKVDAEQVYATVDFYGSGSKILDANSGSTVTHSWEFGSGATPTTSTSADPTGVQMPVGENIVKHTVTDASNSQTRTQYVLCRVFDDNDPPFKIETESLQLSGTESDGWECTFTMLESHGIDTIPDKAWVIIFAEEIYNGTQQSFGNRNSGRASIKFVGVLRNDVSTNDAESGRKDLTFTAVSPIQELRDMKGFSQRFDSKVTANTWQEIEAMTIERIIVQLLGTYTTALDTLDFYYEAGDYSYPKMRLQTDTPYGQLMELVDGLGARFVSDRTCNLSIQQYPEFYAISDRSGLTTTYTLAGRDLKSIQVDRNHHTDTGLLEARGFIFSTIDSLGLYSHWPSRTPGEGAQDTVIEWMLIESQDDLNEKAGLRGAKLNHVYIDSNGQRQIAPRITATLYRDVWDFWQEWLAFSLDASSNYREVDLSGLRWVIRDIDVSYREGAIGQVRLTLDAETAAPAGQTYIPSDEGTSTSLPDPDDIEVPPIDIIEPPDPGPIPLPTFEQGTGDAAAVLNDGRICVTSNFNDTSPSWTVNSHVAALGTAIGGTFSETIVSYATDPSSAFFTSGSGAVGAWLVSESYWFHVSDIFAASPTITLLHTFAYSTADKMIDADFVFNPGTHVCCVYSKANDKVVAAYSTDGATVTEVDINTTTSLTTTGGVPQMFYSTTSVNTIWAWATWNTSGSGIAQGWALAKSTTGGASWAFLDPLHTKLTYGLNGAQGPTAYYIPFRGSGDNIQYVRQGDGLGVIDVASEAQQTISIPDWDGREGKFVMQCAYQKNVVYFLMQNFLTGAIFKTTSPKSYSPNLNMLPGGSITSTGLDGLDCSPDGSEIVIWDGDEVYYWSESNPTFVSKGSVAASASIEYVFVK